MLRARAGGTGKRRPAGRQSGAAAVDLTAIKAAAVAAPVNQAGLSYTTAPTVTVLAQNDTPTFPGGYVRHFISGVQGVGTQDLTSASNIYNHTAGNSLVQNGAVTNNFNDGSKAQYWGVGKYDTAGERGIASPTMIAFRHTGRYLAYPSQTQAFVTLTVGGAIAHTAKYTANNQNRQYDFGSVATRDILLTGADNWYSEVSTGVGETISQLYNPFTPKPTFSWLGDSYLNLSADWTTTKLLFVDLMTQLCGGRGLTCNAIGSTGYTNNNGDPVNTPAAMDPSRGITMSLQQPDVGCICLGINDAWPGAGATDFVAGATTVLQRARANCKLLVVMGPWAPNQTQGANPGGSYQQKKNALRNIMATLSGPWIYLDNLSGGWITSKGTSSAGTGPWQTGDGYVGNTTGTGNGDTWVSADGTHPTELGYRGLAALFAQFYKAALATM